MTTSIRARRSPSERLFRVAQRDRRPRRPGSAAAADRRRPGRPPTAPGSCGCGTRFAGRRRRSPPSRRRAVSQISSDDRSRRRAEDPARRRLRNAAFRRGDYWTCAARADGSIDWPSPAACPNCQAPHGPEARYAPLAVADGPADRSEFEDCRIPFAHADRPGAALPRRRRTGGFAPGTAPAWSRCRRSCASR